MARRRRRSRRRYGDVFGHEWAPYVPVASRRAQGQREVEARRKSGQTTLPVIVEGRHIARSFWGKAWCDNLERYSDYANRLPRGRTYVRNRSVVHLDVHPGRVEALVSGSDLYQVSIDVKAANAKRWRALCLACAGGIDSLVDLLQGQLADGVMAKVCEKGTGLFPTPAEIELSCSCPDWAAMCKHVAAVLYGVGARLDEQPDLLFRLRQVDPADMVAAAAGRPGKAGSTAPPARVLSDDASLADVFGIELDGAGTSDASPTPPRAERVRPATRRKATRKRAPSTKPKKAATKKSGTKKAARKKATATKVGPVKARPKKAATKRAGAKAAAPNKGATTTPRKRRARRPK